MGGLLGYLKAGGAAAAGASANVYERKVGFDLQKALLDAQMDKELRLEEIKYQRGQERSNVEKERIAGLTNEIGSQYDEKVAAEPGGYDPNDPEGKNRRKFGELDEGERASVIRKGLMDKGEYAYADQYNKDIDRFDKNAASEAKLALQSQLLDLKRQGLINEYEYKNKTLELQGELNVAKMGKIKAEIEALHAKAAGGSGNGDGKSGDSMAPLNNLLSSIKSAYGMDKMGAYDPKVAKEFEKKYARATELYNDAVSNQKLSPTAAVAWVTKQLNLPEPATPTPGANGPDFSHLWTGKK